MLGAATEKARLLRFNLFPGTKAHLPRLSLVLGTESCYEVDDLSCLVMFDRCTRLAKWSSRCVARARYVRMDSFNLMR